MKMIHQFIIIMIMAASAAAQSTGQAPNGRAGGSFNDEYGIIVQKNIFLKDRRSSNGDRHHNYTPPPPAPPVEKTYKLIGVAVGDQDSRAYFEHSGNVVHLTIGDELASGRITGIEVSGVQYESNGKQTLVKVGEDLTGTIVSSPARGGATSMPSSAQTTVAPAPAESKPAESGATTGSTDNGGTDSSKLSVEEMMRRRRQQALGQ